GEVETLGCDGLGAGIECAFGQFGFGAERAGHPHTFADATDGPVEGAGRLLDDVIFRDAIPRDGPARAPAVAGTHGAAIFEIETAIGGAAIVHEHARGPAL